VRESTANEDLERPTDALTAVGIAPDRIYLDNKSGAAVDRPGLRAVLGFARRGDVIVVHILDRLGRTVRDTLHLIHELTERGAGVGNLADPPLQLGSWRCCCWRCSPRRNRPHYQRAGGARPGGGRRARPASGPTAPAGPSLAGVRGAPARRRPHDGPDRGHDRDDRQQPVPVRTVPPAGCGVGGAPVSSGGRVRVGERLVTVLLTLGGTGGGRPGGRRGAGRRRRAEHRAAGRHTTGVGGSPTDARGDSGAGRSGAAMAGGGGDRRHAAAAGPGR